MWNSGNSLGIGIHGPFPAAELALSVPPYSQPRWILCFPSPGRDQQLLSTAEPGQTRGLAAARNNLGKKTPYSGQKLHILGKKIHILGKKPPCSGQKTSMFQAKNLHVLGKKPSIFWAKTPPYSGKKPPYSGGKTSIFWEKNLHILGKTWAQGFVVVQAGVSRPSSQPVSPHSCNR